MIDVSKYIEETNNAVESDEAFDILESTLKEIGIDRVIYSLMTDHASIGKKAGHGILRNYPEDWMKYYVEKEYENADPVRKHIMNVSGAFRWSDLKVLRNGLENNEDLLMNEAGEAKLLDGVGLGLHAPRGEVLGMGFASSSGGVDLNKHTLSLINLLATQFHTVYVELNIKTANKNKPKITCRQKEVLYWCYRGKSYNDIGGIIGITERTVKFHLSEIFSRLNVNSKITAVLKAIQLGLIIP